MLAAIQHVGDVVDPFGTRGGVAGSGAQVDVPEPRGDLVDRDAGLKATRPPVGAEGVWVRKPLGHARCEAVTAHDAMHGDSRQGERLLVGVASKAHEQGMLVEQRDAARERVDRGPRVERLLGGFGDRDFALALALGAHKQAKVPRVGARAAQIAGPQAA